MRKVHVMNVNLGRFDRGIQFWLLAASCGLSAIPSTTSIAQAQCLETHLMASDAGPFNFMGTSLAIAGDIAVVGDQDDSTPAGASAGSVYVYTRTSAGWVETAHLFASDGAASDFFGYTVALSGDTLVIGAYGDNTPNGTNAGSAYVFVRNGNDWVQQGRLFANDAAANDEFGAVAISGDTIVVGALSDNTQAGADAGSAYVFVRQGTTWWLEQHLFASDAAAGDLFGNWVAIDGDEIVVGAQLDDTGGGVDAGSAYVFKRSEGIWTETAHLVASDGGPGDNFGFDVEISGDTIGVSAILDDTPAGGVDAGSAYLFKRDEVGWVQHSHVFAPDGAADDRFGSDIAISGDTVVITANRDDTSAGVDAGSAYIFTRSIIGWIDTGHFFAPDAAAGDRFGVAVEMSGDTMLVGAFADDTIAGVDAGSAYTFDLGCTGDLNCDFSIDMADVPQFVEALLDAGDFEGCDIYRADVNRDGFINGLDVAHFANLLVN